MRKNKQIGLKWAVVLGAFSFGLLPVFASSSTDFTYQSLTNLGPCASSRVLLMNNDTNSKCPIQGQGYHDTSNTVAVGQTYWWHDDTQVTEEVVPGRTVDYYLNLKTGTRHILYHKVAENTEPVKLWELIDCRAGSAARTSTGALNYLPWSETCQPIDAVFSAPIPVEYTMGFDYSNGTKQVASVIMRATTESAIYSPFYEDGVGEIVFDAVNFSKMYGNSHIAVEIAYDVLNAEESMGISQELDMSKLDWVRQTCEVYNVSRENGYVIDVNNNGKSTIHMASTKGADNMFYRIRVRVNKKVPLRFKIIRVDRDTSNNFLDYNDLILVDNIIVSYPMPSATLTPTGIDSEGEGFAKIGRVGAFTEPFLSKGLNTAKPRMTCSAETNGLPPFIDWKVSVTNSDFVWRWCYLNQAYGPWTTNKMSVAENGTALVGDEPISVTNRIGDIEYYYVADVAGSQYKFLDFADYTDKVFPNSEVGSTRLRYPDTTTGATNYTSRIREGISPWQEMHIEAYVITNAAENLVATNDWTMELISDHTWRGFVFTPTNYAGCVANIRFAGKNMWESNAVVPAVASKTWYFPVGEIMEIPMGGVAIASLPDGKQEQDIILDATSGYLMFEFNDQSGAFTMNRAEYQDFNMWTPQNGQAENRYIGNYVNTSYVGRAKQEYTLDLGKWPMSRSTSAYWWENFDAMAGNKDYPFGEPFGLNKQTPNGWVANHGMFINGMFSLSTNKATYGMALQLQGRGLGTLSLIDPADVPQGIGTVSFSARLAQYLEFGDFCYHVDGTAKKNYAISAKAAMTHHRQAFYDGSTGSPSLSLVTYYRPGKGCYEFRITRIYSTYDNLWDNYGRMELALYKWQETVDPETGDFAWEAKKLTSLVAGNDGGKFKNYMVPATSGTNVIDNANWSSVYFAAYNNADGSTYIEGALGVSANGTSYAYDDFKLTGSAMKVVSFTDTDSPFTKGSYGVCSCECPGVFGHIQLHKVSGAGPYKASGGAFSTGKFAACPEGSSTTEDSWRWISKTINDGDWDSGASKRIVRFDQNQREDYVTGTKYYYGLCAAPVTQKLYLKMAPHGESSKWTDSGLDFSLTSYIATNLVFSPRTTTPANVQISVGGNSRSPRTDVVIDDIEISQWKGDSSISTDLGSTTKWAFTDAWIAGTTNDVYQGAGSSSDDSVAAVSKCGYYVKQLNDTEFIYVFTNTTAGALGDYATFVPKQDMIVKELFVLGAGGGGGPGGGGGGGGNAIWVTNDVEYAAGEEGIKVYVGNGGGGGSVRYSSTDVRPSIAGSGGTSYVYLKNPLKPSETQQYRGYGGYRGGNFYRANDVNAAGGGASNGGGAGGGSALISAGHKPPAQKSGNTQYDIMDKDLHTYGREIYAAGYGGAAVDGAPGGGGGGGLRGIAPDTGSNYGAGNASNPTSVIRAGFNGEDGTAGTQGGNGGDGFPLEALGESEVRYAIGELLGDNNAWLGGGGGGGSGYNTEANQATWGKGAVTPGLGGNWSGGDGGLHTEYSYASNKAGGKDGKMFAGGGGGGGTFVNPVTSGNNNTKNWILGGGKGGGGLVVMHVKVKDRFVMLQPMRGSETRPMSVRTPFMNGISLLSFSWKDANENAILKVQVSTNDVNDSNIRSRTESIDNEWIDFGAPIKFADMADAERAQGSTNILIGFRAPASGIVRVLVDPTVVAAARKGSTNNLDSMYGTVIITGMKVYDEPELDDRSWWGWNIMPTYKLEWSSLYDPVTLGPGRSCGLNFSGIAGTGADDPLFADDPEIADYAKHDPFVQTPRFTNRIGAVMFKARVLETNLTTESGWVTISACSNPSEEDDAKWDVLTNIEVTASTTVFEPFLWRLPSTQSDYQALRLTAKGAKSGRNSSDAVEVPVQRVLIDEVVVTQPMAPKLSFKNVYPFRHNTDKTESIPPERISSPDEQPILGETFGMQVQIVPAGMEDELDKDSIRVYMAWYAGDEPWGYKKWKDEKYATKKVELKQASDWSHDKLVYRSHPNDAHAFIPPQMAGDYGHQFVQFRIWAEYKNKNGIEQDPSELTRNDWVRPKWYFGINDPNDMNDAFSAYTVLDTISPKRAWFNEINAYDGNTETYAANQYIEVAVPQGFDMTGWSVQCIKNDEKYDLYPVAEFGVNGVVSHKTSGAYNSYSFIALQSPKTKSANTHPKLNDGVWKDTAFDGSANAEIDKSNPYALRLVRPSGIIEHEVVFMSTNTSTSRVWYLYEGTNLHATLKAKYPGNDFIYAGKDAYAASLGVYTGHGESELCWTNTMRQTPGEVNVTAEGVTQYIDLNYFEPPKGTNLWIYANIDPGSVNSLFMVFGEVTNTSAVIIVPQNADGTFTTNIEYVVKKWFEMDRVVTNETGKAAGVIEGVEGNTGRWKLQLNGIKLSDPESRKFEVTAFTRDTSKIANLKEKGIDKNDPYYPAVVDWLQRFDEGDIKLAEYWNSEKGPYIQDGEPRTLSLKEMYWLDIPPVSKNPSAFENSEWVVKGWMSGRVEIPVAQTNVFTGECMTNVRVSVTMMISNRLENVAHAPCTLQGVEPGSTSSNYTGSAWNSVAFSITGVLLNNAGGGQTTGIRRPLNWFTFGPNSFTNFTRQIEVVDPFSKNSVGYSYGWYLYPQATVGYAWSIGDATNRPPTTIYQLNDDTALIGE